MMSFLFIFSLLFSPPSNSPRVRGENTSRLRDLSLTRLQGRLGGGILKNLRKSV